VGGAAATTPRFFIVIRQRQYDTALLIDHHQVQRTDGEQALEQREARRQAAALDTRDCRVCDPRTPSEFTLAHPNALA
jgi:hypothetical protein